MVSASRGFRYIFYRGVSSWLEHGAQVLKSRRVHVDVVQPNPAPPVAALANPYVWATQDTGVPTVLSEDLGLPSSCLLQSYVISVDSVMTAP